MWQWQFRDFVRQRDLCRFFKTETLLALRLCLDKTRDGDIRKLLIQTCDIDIDIKRDPCVLNLQCRDPMDRWVGERVIKKTLNSIKLV